MAFFREFFFWVALFRGRLIFRAELLGVGSVMGCEEFEMNGVLALLILVFSFAMISGSFGYIKIVRTKCCLVR